MTENQRAYLEEVRKLQNRVKSFEKKGYKFENIERYYELPKNKSGKIYVGKKDIENISKLKRKELAKEAYEYETSEGMIITGEEAYVDRAKPIAKREYEYKDLRSNEETYDNTYNDEYYDYTEDDIEYDYTSDELYKSPYDLLSEKIESLNWLTEDEQNYLLDVVADEYSDNEYDEDLWSKEEYLSDNLPDVVIDSEQMRYFFGTLKHSGYKTGRISSEHAESATRMMYAIQALRSHGVNTYGQNVLTERDLEFLAKY